MFDDANRMNEIIESLHHHVFRVIPLPLLLVFLREANLAYIQN